MDNNENFNYALDYNTNLVEGSKALDDIEQTLNELIELLKDQKVEQCNH